MAKVYVSFPGHRAYGCGSCPLRQGITGYPKWSGGGIFGPPSGCSFCLLHQKDDSAETERNDPSWKETPDAESVKSSNVHFRQSSAWIPAPAIRPCPTWKEKQRSGSLPVQKYLYDKDSVVPKVVVKRSFSTPSKAETGSASGQSASGL